MAIAPCIVLPDEGRKLRAPSGAEVVVKLASATTGGAFTVVVMSRERGDARGPRAHRHANMDETFFVLEGAFVFELDGHLFDAPAGTIVFVPRGARHRIRSAGAMPGRLLVISAPGGVDAFFEEIADSNVRLDDAFRRHGFAFDDPDGSE